MSQSNVWVDGDQTDHFRFTARVPHGKASRPVTVSVPAETVRQLATIMQHTNCPGHAAWHLRNPDSEIPCSACSMERRT